MGGKLNNNVENYTTYGSDNFYDTARAGLEHNQTKGYEVVEEAVQKKVPLKQETKEKVKIAEIQKRLEELKIKAPKLYAMLSSSGILKNDLENTEQLKKIEGYMDYLNFLYTVTRKGDTPGEVSQEIADNKKSELVKRYLELESEKTDYIGNKEFLQFKFAEAVLSDIKRMGYFIVKDSNGAYKVKGIDTLRDYGNASKFSKIKIYSKLFETRNTNNSAIDTAILSNVIVHNSEMKEVTSQKQFINKLLDKYNVLPKKRKNIEDKTDYLILDKDEITKNIKTKLQASKSAQEIKELSILLDFVENKRWEQKTSYDRFNKANTYAKGFLVEKEFINAYRTGKLDNLKGGNASALDKITAFANQNRPGAIIFGILAWLMGFKKTAIGAIGFGIFGGAATDLIKGGVDTAKSAFKEDIINPLEKDQVATLLDNKEYQKNYNKMVKVNSELDNNQLTETTEKGVVIDSGVKQLKPKKLNQMITAITTNSINVDLTKIESKVIDDLKSKLGEGYTREEVTKLVKLFKKSNIKEDGDKTTLDYLSDGLDINNRPYKDINPLNISSFDEKINNTLKEEYNTTKGNREKRKDFLKIYNAIDSISSGFKIGDVSAKIITGLNSKLSEVKALTEQYKTEFPGLWNKLNPIFENYKKYIKVENELDGFTGPWDESNIGDTAKILFKETFNLSKTQDYIDLYDKIDSKITALEKLKLTGSLANQEPFKSLNTRIDNVLRKLETSRDKVLEKLREQGVNIQETFKKEKFDTKPGKVRDRVVKYIRDLKDFENNLSNISIGDLNDKLDDIKSKYKYLQSGLKLVNSGKLVIDTTNRAKETTQTELINKLSTDFVNLDLKGAIKSKLESFYNENNTQLTKLDSIDTTSNFEDDIKALDEVEQYLSSKGNIDEVDNKTKEAKQKAEAIFGNLGLTNTTTLKDVSDKYETKKTEVKTKAQTTLSSIEANINTLNDKQKIKDAYKTVKKIGELFPNIRAENILHKLEIHYINNVLVKNDNGVKQAINRIYNYTGNDNNLKNISQSFKNIVNNNISSVYNDSIITLLNKMKQKNELRNAANIILEKLDLYK